jgi:hypothetical protein
MNGIGPVPPEQRPARLPKSSPRAADQTAANAAHAAQSRAVAQLSADRGHAAPGTIMTDQQLVASTGAAAIRAEAGVKNDSGLDVTA